MSIYIQKKRKLLRSISTEANQNNSQGELAIAATNPETCVSIYCYTL